MNPSLSANSFVVQNRRWAPLASGKSAESFAEKPADTSRNLLPSCWIVRVLDQRVGLHGNPVALRIYKGPAPLSKPTETRAGGP